MEPEGTTTCLPSRRYGTHQGGVWVSISRYQGMKERLEIPMIAASLLVIPVLIIEETTSDPTVGVIAWTVNSLIWLIFLCEYAVLLWYAPDRRQFVRTHLLDLAIIILSPPLLLPEGMSGIMVLRSLRVMRLTRTARIVRLARASRLLRLFVAAARAVDGADRVLRRHGTYYVVTVALVVLLAGGGLFFWAERNHVQDIWEGLWWAITTVTTVGYGDITPQTGIGRLLAVVIMVLGIGLMAVITANIASWFVEQDRQTESESIQERLSRIEEQLRQLESLIADNLVSDTPGGTRAQVPHSPGLRGDVRG